MLPVILVTVFIVVGILALVILSHHRALKMTSIATGEVVEVEEREIRTHAERRDETRVVCRFSVSGEQHQIEETIAGKQAWRYAAGTEVEIRYNPAEPHMAQLH